MPSRRIGRRKTIMPFFATMNVRIFGQIHELDGRQATYIPPDHPTAPLKGGWLVREATINPPLDDDILRESGEILSRVEDTKGFPPPIFIASKTDKSDPSQPPVPDSSPPAVLTPHSEVAYLASVAPLPLCLNLPELARQLPPGSKDGVRSGHVFPEVEPDVPSDDPESQLVPVRDHGRTPRELDRSRDRRARRRRTSRSSSISGSSGRFWGSPSSS